MENLIETIETRVNNLFEDFKEKPVKTSIKVIIILLILKYVYKKFIKDD